MGNKNVPSVNDGKGFVDNEGMCDLLITDCNSLVQDLISGQCVRFCLRIGQMVQKLTNLKTGIHNDLTAKDRIIEELKRINDSLVNKSTGLPVDKTIIKDGAENGAE